MPTLRGFLSSPMIIIIIKAALGTLSVIIKDSIYIIYDLFCTKYTFSHFDRKNKEMLDLLY